MGSLFSREEDADFEKTLDKRERPVLTTSGIEGDPHRLGRVQVGNSSVYSDIVVEGPKFTPILDPLFDSGKQEYKVFSTTSVTNGPNLAEINHDTNLSSGQFRTGVGYHRSLGSGTSGMISGEALYNTERLQGYSGVLGVSQSIDDRTTLVGGGNARFDQNHSLLGAGINVGVERRSGNSSFGLKGQHEFYGRAPRTSIMGTAVYRI